MNQQTHPARLFSASRRKRGAQPGNKNNTRPRKATANLMIRCSPADKGAWTKAANRAAKNGLIKADSRGNLAPWVVCVLNEAAAKGSVEHFPQAAAAG